MSAWMSIGCCISAPAQRHQLRARVHEQNRTDRVKRRGEGRDAPEPMKSAHSSVSSRPMRMSRWRLDWGRMGMCGFCRFKWRAEMK